MAILVWIEHDEHTAHPNTKRLIQAATSFAQPVFAVLAGQAPQKVANEVAQMAGVEKVCLVTAPYYYPFRAEAHALLLQELAADFSGILALATTTGKNILARFAGLQQQAMLSDVIQIHEDGSMTHPIYAGNALARRAFKSGKIIASIRGSAFDNVGTQNACPIEALSPAADDTRSKVLTVAKRDASQLDLQTAKIIVSGGRGLGNKEQFDLVFQLAKVLGAAVGATRAAVDAGFVSNDLQVGQTGKVVAPELYIALGISGAIQHLAGMKDAKTIIAINKDPDAPIFELATYALVGDIFAVLPELISKLS